MRLPILLACLVLSIASLSGQNIQVVEQNTQEPIAGVAIFNDSKTKSDITDFDGYVNISKFDNDEDINFQHISHSDLKIKKSEILLAGNMVQLSTSADKLEEVVLSVSKFGQQKKNIPQQIVSVTSEEVLFTNPQTSADLLESTGKVYIQKSQLGGGSPLIRGFSTNRLLIAVDGIRFNTAIFRGGNVQNVISIDPFAIERTEVILGPGSVVYGSDAIGGVINFYTKKPKFSFIDGMSFSGNAIARYASANNEKTGHVDFNIGLKEWAFLTSVSYSDFDDLKMGKYGPDEYLRHEYVSTLNGEDIVVANSDPREQVPTGYDQINFMQKVRYMPSETLDFNLGLFYTSTSDYSRYDRLLIKKDGEFKSAEWYYGPQQWMSANLQMGHKGASIYDDSKLTLSYQQFKESRNDRNFGEIILYEKDETVHAYSGGWDFIKKFKEVNLYYGIEYIYNLVNSEGQQTDVTNGSSTEDASRYPDGATWQSLAAYSSVQWQLNNELSFQGGLRYNHILLDASFDNRFYDFPFSEANINTGALTGSAGLAWNPNKILGWKLNFSTAFRAPNVDDVGKVFDSEPGSVVVPNPDLKAEYSYTGELGATLNFEDVVKLDLATYMTVLSDAMVRRDFSLDGETEIIYQGELSNVQAIQNASEVEVFGFEAGIEINFTKFLQLRSQYNIASGYELEEDGSKVPARHVVPQFGNTHLIFTANKWKLDAFAIYNGQYDYEDLAPSQQNNPHLYAIDDHGNPYSPNWYTLNFAAQYKFTRAWQVNMVLENITNQRYRHYSSGIAATGFNLIIAANYTF
jgi:hemoglobin/transferrin/lactoferrin receptor protein